MTTSAVNVPQARASVNRRSARPSITDVAQSAAVSIATVSRVMNGNREVSAPLRDRVLVACHELGFAPKRAVDTVAIIIGGKRFPVGGYLNRMVALVANELTAHHMVMELIDESDIAQAFHPHIKGVLAIVFDDHISALSRCPNLPVVTLNYPLAEHGIHSVCTDHYQQAVLATQHVLANGHRRIALFDRDDTAWGTKKRIAGFLHALSASGVSVADCKVFYTGGRSMIDLMRRAIASGVTAVVNFADEQGLEAYHLLTHVMGLSVPRDVSFITMEDEPVYEYLSPPCTVVVEPLRQMVCKGVDILTEQFEAAEKASTLQKSVADICLPSELIARESVAPVVG